MAAAFDSSSSETVSPLTQSSLQDDIITPVPEILHYHSQFNKRHLFPLQPSHFDWFFKSLPTHFKTRYESSHSDLEALDTFFWDAAHEIRATEITDIGIYYITLEASRFYSFVQKMESYCFHYDNGAFVVPITRICRLEESSLNANPYSDLFKYHRHLIVFARDGLHFANHCFANIHPALFLISICMPLTWMLKYKAFNSVPATRLSDYLKVCPIQQIYNDPIVDDTKEFFNIIRKRLNAAPVQRVDSF